MTTESNEQIPSVLPVHVAIIMDGNGRWAEQRHLPRLAGHQEGARNVRTIIRHLGKRGIKFVTIYSFSTENWLRPQGEVNGLLQLFQKSIEEYLPEIQEMNVRLRHLGRLAELPLSLQQAIQTALATTRDNTRMTLSFALNYGGRTEIIDATRAILQDNIAPAEVTEALFQRYLYTRDIPDVDFVIRTGGEMRISNYLLWQCAYSEYYFTPILWPSFDESAVDQAIMAYSRRQRRFGQVSG
jgi:undecaprenyl diphosphate synthase